MIILVHTAALLRGNINRRPLQYAYCSSPDKQFVKQASVFARFLLNFSGHRLKLIQSNTVVPILFFIATQTSNDI